MCKSALTAAGRLRHHGGSLPTIAFLVPWYPICIFCGGGEFCTGAISSDLIPLFRSFLTALTTRHLNFYRLDLIIRVVLQRSLGIPFALTSTDLLLIRIFPATSDPAARPFCSGNGSRFFPSWTNLGHFPFIRLF